MMVFIILRCHLFHNIILNVHAPTEGEIDVKGSFYKEPEGILDKKNAVFWDLTPHGSCKNRHIGET
jgi:hypothetical protein